MWARLIAGQEELTHTNKRVNAFLNSSWVCFPSGRLHRNRHTFLSTSEFCYNHQTRCVSDPGPLICPPDFFLPLLAEGSKKICDQLKTGRPVCGPCRDTGSSWPPHFLDPFTQHAWKPGPGNKLLTFSPTFWLLDLLVFLLLDMFLQLSLVLLM